MIRTKTFVKKTKKGGILKIVREHYLRDDIWCGSSLCDSCQFETNAKILESDPSVPTSALCSKIYYLLPDTNVLLDQVQVYYQFSILKYVTYMFIIL